MTHNYTYLLTHIVFGTWDRAPIISPEMHPSLFEYMGGIVREIEAVPMTINGMPDHVHLLVSMPPKLAVADLVRVVKANSSRWVHEKWPGRRDFAWQGGYGAFSVSQSLVEQAMRAHSPLRIRYASSDGRQSERVVQPLRVTLREQATYLVAYCHLKQEERTFRMDRIVELRIEGLVG